MRDVEQLPQPALSATSASIDAGLRRYLLAVYAKVALGLVAAAAIAFATSTVPLLRDLMFRPGAAATGGGVQLTFVGMIVAFGPIFALLTAGRVLARPTPANTGALYWTVVSLFGASMGVLFLIFTGLSIATTFAVTAAAFGGLSLWGYTTRRDLTAFGAFLTVGLVGLVLTLVVNLILRSPMASFILGTVGTFIFAGLIAWDTQRLKLAYEELGGVEAARGVASNLGALSLFINFLNLFQFLLMMMSGDRR